MKHDRRSDAPRKPLKSAELRALALHYVSRYATTRAKLATYLSRKVNERGWDDEKSPNIVGLVTEFAEAGYIDDAAFAEARARAFVRRGYGERRLGQDLFASGIEDSDSVIARETMSDGAFDAAFNFARRRRIGPFANEAASPETRQKQLAAFLRAGHRFELARRFVDAEPGDDIGPDDLA